MANIKVDPDVLDQKAANIRQYRQQHDEAIDKLVTLVNGLDGEWVGSAKNNFTNSFNEYKGSFSTFSQRMEDLAKALDAKAKEYRAADNQG